MNGFYGHKRMTATIITDASVSTAINISSYNKIAIEIPTISVGCNTDACSVRVKVCHSETGTYRTLYDMGVYSAVSGIDAWEVPSNIGGYTVLCRPAVGFHYMKIELYGTNCTATAGLGAYVHGIQ